ncbi:branched-chain amino acid ABC transporter permease [Agrobacterium tumefaciens]|uniref:branched-chain amino acid ABC transporter permease n=1 Tax=Agrobacterium tumefaciens complex TaxID=1183400 RepID=UPI00157426D3|nr:branched-chain amino acid ABC transporter permease [Agrobacterium fabrum]NSZ09697.1 branched-chain amino acid ABC transporter permease [Agrobacterium tumefaciens]
MTLEALLQVLASGLLMGLLYALIAVGLSLIFGLMDVVNFAHGEFMMVAMYVVFGVWAVTAIEPILLIPLATAALFAVGALVYLGIVRFAMRGGPNAGMVQIFATFGLAIFLQGISQYFFTPDYRSITDSWLGNKTIQFLGLYLPAPQLFGAAISLAAFVGLYLLMSRTDFGKALEATREDQGAVALVGINKNKVFAIGWGLGAALVGLAGSVLAIFFYIHPHVGAPFALVAYVVVALGGFGSVFGALAAGITVGLVEALAALALPSSMKQVAVYALYLLVVFIRPSGLFGRL